MKSIDFLIQTAVLLATLVLALAGFADRSMWLFVMLAQLFIGFWQYVGGIVWLIAYPKIKSRRIYIVVATAYLIVLFLGAEYYNMINRFSHNIWYGAYVFGLPWLLAIYYYVITWRSVILKSGKLSKFLPHISF